MRYFDHIEHLNYVKTRPMINRYDKRNWVKGSWPRNPNCRRNRGAAALARSGASGEYRPFSSSELVGHGADTGFVAAVRGTDLGFDGSDLWWLGPADLVLRTASLVAGSSPGGMADRVAHVPPA